jgi:hypothetical protein
MGLAVWAGTICLMFSSVKYFGKDYCRGKKVEKFLTSIINSPRLKVTAKENDMQHYTIKGTELGKDVYVEPVEQVKEADTDKPKVYLRLKTVKGVTKIVSKEER